MAAMDLANIERVLVVKPSSLGDIIHTLPVAQALARLHPHWQIDWIASTPWLPLLQEHPSLQRVIEFPRQNFRGLGARKFFSWLKALRESGKYQLALDFQGLQRSALIAKFALSEGEAWGVAELREGAGIWLQQRAQALPKKAHALERYHALGVLAGLNQSVADLPAAILPEGTCPARAQNLGTGDFCLIHPYSRGAGKALEPRLLRQLLEGLGQRQQKQVVLVGRAAESVRLVDLPVGVLDLTNQTSLGELCWLLRRAAVVISVDSGPMHLAAAMDVPLLGLHAWSNPQLVGPWRPAGMRPAWVWKAGELNQANAFPESKAEKESQLDESCVEAALTWVRELV